MKFVDLFAGLGGFHLAAKDLGGRCVFACEIDEKLQANYEANFGIKPESNIKKVNPNEIPEHDLLCAGFPCQPFSKAGDQLGWKDSIRGTVFYNIVEILRIRKPKYIILENVAHFVRHDEGNTYSKVKIVKSKLHGHITPEACFVEEGLRTVSLREFLPDDERELTLEVQVPSPTNLLLLKLFAFKDRDEGHREDSERAQAHAWDVYVTIMLTDREDYLEGQDFLSQHKDSVIIQNARSIVASKFNAIEQAGWRRVLESSDFYPGLNRREKEARLDEARRRLLRWFDIS